ncbi:hypothetical protein Pint_26687 [Pistacia integerrima]|uniref:Uncharacterized protein n=1 Tax=Pistacia integerrima TaxID=434235 RepID=A0ACC0YRZ6_9ROSI|nr:hypothetical protein Pint_26687 [Pistacia integerrima]
MEVQAQKPVVLITGYSQGGIGHALAYEFASKDENVKNCVANVIEKFGRIDILINNVGVPCVSPLAELPLSTMERTFNTNVYDVDVKFR